MRRFGVKFRVVSGMVGLTVSIVILAMYLNIIPDRIGAVRDGRISLAESIAVHCTALVMGGETPRLENDLNLLAERNPDLLSFALRRLDGRMLVTAGDHENHWKPLVGEYSTENQILVPISDGEKRWGQLELRFTPMREEGLMGVLQTPAVKIGLFIGLACFLAFYFYLGRVLRQLDPSQAIPGRVRAALDTMAEGLLVLDRKEQVVLANKAFATLIDKSPDSLLGHRAGEFPWTDTEGKKIEKKSRPWIQAMSTGELVANQMMRLQLSEHDRRTFNVSCSPVLGAAGKYAGVLVSFDDVTQLEQKEIELRISKEEAERANQAKSVFLASMSHEIRTPMNAILGFTEILKRGYARSKEETLRHLNTIHSSGKSLLALINDILDLSKVESGRIEMEKTYSEPHRIIHEVLQILKVQADEKGLYLRFEAKTPLPEKIETDPARFRQIVFNLVGNALKFTEQGGVTVAVHFNEKGAEPRLVVDVADTGIGIPADKVQSIFDPFTQADSSVTRRFGGTGLGLSISRRFARLLGGDIQVASKIGKGSTFRVLLAAGDTTGIHLLQPEETAMPLEKRFNQDTGMWQFNKARVLVVEDGVETRELIRLLLERTGLDVEEAENGAEGVKKAAAKAYDVVLMDVNMPIMDGFTAATKMRQKGLKAPIVALTANAMKGFEQECLDAGYSNYLTKPIEFDPFMNLMADLVGGQQVREPAGAVSGLSPSQTNGTAHKKQDDEPIPIVSKLPSDNEAFAKIIVRFASQLGEKLQSAQQARSSGNLEQIAAFAHWLKGAGGTVGFDEFTKPARRLEQLAKEGGKESEIADALAAIRSLAGRVKVPGMKSGIPSVGEGKASVKPAPDQRFSSGTTPSAAIKPLVSRFSDQPEFERMIHSFLRSLEENMEKMEQAYQHQDWTSLASLAHWLKGSGSTVGFDEFTKPALALETFAQARQRDQAGKMLNRVKHLKNAILPPPIEGMQKKEAAPRRSPHVSGGR